MCERKEVWRCVQPVRQNHFFLVRMYPYWLRIIETSSPLTASSFTVVVGMLLAHKLQSHNLSGGCADFVISNLYVLSQTSHCCETLAGIGQILLPAVRRWLCRVGTTLQIKFTFIGLSIWYCLLKS